MTCVHCGIGDCDHYTLRFSPEGGEERRTELELCEGCLEQFLTEANADLIEPNIVLTDDIPSDIFPDSLR